MGEFSARYELSQNSTEFRPCIPKNGPGINCYHVHKCFASDGNGKTDC